MKITLLFAAVLIGCFFAGLQAEMDDTSSTAEVVVWVGPGWYYGIWFSTETEFNDWMRANYHTNHQQCGPECPFRKHQFGEYWPP